MKRGFTLMELLAVITILGLISLIATPIVIKVIANVKVSSIEKSRDNYLSAIKNDIAFQVMNHVNIKNGLYSVMDDGNLCNGTISNNICDGSKLNPNFTGTKPNKGWVRVANEKVINYSLVMNNHVLTKNKDTKSGTTVDVYKTCKLISGNEFEIGSKYTCDLGDEINRNFYIIEVSTDNISLIMDRNYYDNTVSKTLSWCDQSGINPTSNTCNGDGLTDSLNYLKDIWPDAVVSMPTNNILYNVNNDVKLDKTPWLYDNLTGSTGIDTDIYGYWTSSQCSSNEACVVNHGQLIYNRVDSTTEYGIRPMITILKSNI